MPWLHRIPGASCNTCPGESGLASRTPHPAPHDLQAAQAPPAPSSSPGASCPQGSRSLTRSTMDTPIRTGFGQRPPHSRCHTPSG